MFNPIPNKSFETTALLETYRLSNQRDQILKMMKLREEMNILFIMDCTGSMHEWIHKTKDSLKSIADFLGKKYPGGKVSYAFLGYRDICDKNKQFKF